MIEEVETQNCNGFSRSFDNAKVIIQGTVKGTRRRGRQKQRRERHKMDKYGGWTFPGGSRR